MRWDSAFVAARLAEIRARIDRAACAAGRDGGDVRVVAVTKYLAAAQMSGLRAAGLDCFGENRAQDALPKVEALAGPAAPREWHFIGTLQGNKARAVTGRFHLIHSVDRPELAERVAAAARAGGLRQRVLFQVNISGEAAKHGFTAGELAAAWHRLRSLPGLEAAGLMGMAAEDDPDPRATFRALRVLRDELDPAGAALRELSMGMSGDFEAAVAEGATLVRIGRMLFSEEAGD